MAAEQAQTMLEVWESGQAVSCGERGLMLLRLAEPAMPEAARQALTIGQRDAALFNLHKRLCGPVARAVATCPACAETLELSVALDAIRVDPPAPPPERLSLTWGGRTLTYRLPTAADLAVLGAEAGSPAAAASRLARRLVEADGAALPDDEDDLAALEAAIGDAVALNDPQAVVNLKLDCPACGVHWRSPFDIVDFLWRWFDGFARGLLTEIHLIASAYGWSERDILALPVMRRRQYLRMIGA